MGDMLFPKAELPRTSSVQRMHVADAGQVPSGASGIRFQCRRCGYDTGWIRDEWTVTQNRRGHPCPKCNEARDD